MDVQTNWHLLTIEETLAQARTGLSGLTADEAATRLAQYGHNELQASRRISPWTLLLEQFKNVLIIILLIATLLSAFLGHGVEALVISVIVLFSVLLGFVQEYRAESAIEALRKMAAPTAAVVRGGEDLDIPAREVVPGDVILLVPGDKVPADARLVEAVNLQAVEGALTGESMAVEKHIDALPDGPLSIADRKNMVYAGTAVSYGRGRAVVTTTGMDTEFGKIAKMLQTVETSKTPLQENIDKLGKTLARASLLLVGIIVALGLLRGQPFVEMFIFGVALAVAVVPEALPAVVTISLAIGVQRMVKRHALVRRLPAVETLGGTSIICTDKTGTLTKDEMTVRKICTGGETYSVSGAGYALQGVFSVDSVERQPSAALLALLRGAVQASDAYIVHSESEEHPTGGGWRVKGDPTEGALVVAAAKAGLQKVVIDGQFPRLDEIPFTSERKRMTTLHAIPGGKVVYSKGAVEIILESCTRLLKNAPGMNNGISTELLDADDRETILKAARKMASEGLRVLGVASKPVEGLENAESEMTFLGLVGMFDPPRPEAASAIRTCEQAGIRVVMITGDHPVTAQAIATELGLFKGGRVITGAEFEEMSEADYQSQVDSIDVYARVSPAHKLRVVTTLQEKGQIVAMTGDGVNDAPALKKADIGIAMGITGTDVTKEAAAMMLTDDNFASIVAAVEEGRGIFANIKKYLMYLLSSNIGEIGLMAGATLLGLPLPLGAVQILYVNLATDGLPALALALDPHESDLMKRKPRNPRRGIFTRPVVTLMAIGGLWSTLVNLGLFIWARSSGRSDAQSMTMTFVSLVLIQFFKAYNFRSDRQSVLQRPFANRWLNLAVVWEMVLLVLIVYLPFLHEAFGTYSLSLVDWLIIIGLAFSVSPLLELAKWMERRGWFGKEI